MKNNDHKISSQLKNNVTEFIYHYGDKRIRGNIENGILDIGCPSDIPLIELHDIFCEADPGDYARSIGNLITYSLMLHQRVKDEPQKVQWPDISDDLYSLRILMDGLLNFNNKR